ncbi:CU044_2847 family protein [Streptomyces sp. NPDC051909]|uniref:CU044_2847 family protein n=1 Tax=Streptomyces sp. NPDC051909 TaxID=3154944 RepID=UPI0034153A86
MTDGIARIRLDDGTPVWARVSAAEELRRGGGFQDTGIGDRIGDRVVSMAGGLTDVVRGVVGSLRAGLDPEGSVEVAVSFGIELSAQAGKVIGVLADGGGKASINVSLTWTEPGRPAEDGATRAEEAAPAPADRAAPADQTAPAPRPAPVPAPVPPMPPAPPTLPSPAASPENGPGAV